MVADLWLVTSVPFCMMPLALLRLFRSCPSIITRLNPSRQCCGVWSAYLSVRCAAFGQLTLVFALDGVLIRYSNTRIGFPERGFGNRKRPGEGADGTWSFRLGHFVTLERGDRLLDTLGRARLSYQVQASTARVKRASPFILCRPSS